MGERKIILALSGEIASGKSTLSRRLEEAFGFAVCKTKEGLNHFAKQKFKGTHPDRAQLQSFGESLDVEGGGKWVLDYFMSD